MEEVKRKVEEIKRFRRKWYDDHASTYDRVWWESEEPGEEMDGFKRLVKVENGDVVLDVATGTGIFWLRWLKMEQYVMG
jgi:ubiquinone/menaquinone biosynthesis C-methylase UbiE